MWTVGDVYLFPLLKQNKQVLFLQVVPHMPSANMPPTASDTLCPFLGYAMRSQTMEILAGSLAKIGIDGSTLSQINYMDYFCRR